MTERPIIFSPEMVKAILDGRKTMTRRVIKPQPTFNGTDLNGKPYFIYKGEEYSLWALSRKCPYGQVGNRLWVRETWLDYAGMPIYKADKSVPEVYHWKPSIFMPRWASRLTLEITEVRVERLQEITNNTQDLMAEGLPLVYSRNNRTDWLGMSYKFSLLWDSLNAKRGYPFGFNPWVWVIKFDNIGVRVK